MDFKLNNVDIGYLSTSDKKELIEQLENFPLNDKIWIRTQMSQWLDEDGTINGSKVEPYFKQLVYDIHKLSQKITIIEERETFVHNMIDLLQMPSTSKEDIHRIIITMNRIYKRYKNDHKLLEFMVFQLFKFKLWTYCLCIKLCADIRPEDEHEWNYFVNENCILLNFLEVLYYGTSKYSKPIRLFTLDDEIFISIIIYLMLTLVGIDDVGCSLIFTKLWPDYENIFNRVSEIMCQNGDLNYMINIISEVDYGTYTTDVIHSFDRIFKDKLKKDSISVCDNNDTSIISTKTKNECLVFGDSITSLDNLEKIIYSMKQITPDIIQKYLNTDKNIDFYIQEEKLGFLRYEFKNVKTCLFMDNDAYSVISNNPTDENDNNLYKLFTVSMENKLYGISINPIDNKGTRRIISFTPSLHYTYKIAMGGEEE